MLKKHLLLLSKTVVLLSIFVETFDNFFFQDSLMNRKFKNVFEKDLSAFILNKKSNITNVFTAAFDQFNVSLLNKGINSFQKIK